MDVKNILVSNACKNILGVKWYEIFFCVKWLKNI